jgi:phosphatidylglycerophosphate synthase
MTLAPVSLGPRLSTVPRRRTSAVAVAVTWTRAPVVALLCAAFAQRSALPGLSLLTLFVLLDVLDGVLARASSFGDSAMRRALDSGIDRLGTGAVMMAAGSQVPLLGWLGLALISLSAVALPAAFMSFHLDGLVLKAPKWHKTWSLTLTLAGGLFLMGEDSAACVVAGLGVFVALKCTRALRSQHLTSRR